MTGGDGGPEKDLLQKVATIKRIEYLPLGSELRKQTDIVKNNIKDYTRFMNLVKRLILKTNKLRENTSRQG